MITSLDAYNKYGMPETEKHMMLWDVPKELEIGVIPKKIYCNKIMVSFLCQAFSNLINRGFVKELKTWDGCFVIRPIRGYEKKYKELIKAGKLKEAMNYLSLHSFGLAIDVNANWNKLGQTPTLSDGFVKCFTDAGFDWGGNFKRKDGMHFQLAKI